MAANTPASKKQKTSADDGKSFAVVFEQLAAIKQLVDIVGNVLGRVFLSLVKTKDGDIMMTVDTIDPQHVCIVQSRLQCDGFVNEDDITFCIDTSTLSKCLHNIPPHHSIKFSRDIGSADVVLCSYDAMSNVEDFQFKIHTFEDTNDKAPLEDLQYEYETDVDMASLKRVVKLATGLKCENITLSTYTSTVSNGDVASMTEFSGKGDADFCRTFKSVVSKQNTADAMASVDSSQIKSSDMKFAFSASFSLDYMNRFIKSMEHQLVNIKFEADKPLLMHYPLGIPNSWVRFFLAPKMDE